MRFLVHTGSGRLRPWTDKYGPNMSVVNEHEVMELNPHLESLDEFVECADPDSRDDPAPAPESAPEGPAADDDDDSGDVAATPAAERLAAEHGLDLSTVTGTGRDGTIVKSDVQAALDGENPLDMI